MAFVIIFFFLASVEFYKSQDIFLVEIPDEIDEVVIWIWLFGIPIYVWGKKIKTMTRS